VVDRKRKKGEKQRRLFLGKGQREGEKKALSLCPVGERKKTLITIGLRQPVEGGRTEPREREERLFAGRMTIDYYLYVGLGRGSGEIRPKRPGEGRALTLHGRAFSLSSMVGGEKKNGMTSPLRVSKGKEENDYVSRPKEHIFISLLELKVACPEKKEKRGYGTTPADKRGKRGGEKTVIIVPKRKRFPEIQATQEKKKRGGPWTEGTKKEREGEITDQHKTALLLHLEGGRKLLEREKGTRKGRDSQGRTQEKSVFR